MRDQAKKMPETLMCFLGASGKSVKIICQGELFGGGKPEKEEDIQQFHLNLYETARRAYMNQSHVPSMLTRRNMMCLSQLASRARATD